MSSSAVLIVFLHTSGLITIVGVTPLLVGVCIVSMSVASSWWGEHPLVHECEAEVSVRAPRRRFGFTVTTFFRSRDSVTPPPRRFAHAVRVGVYEKDYAVLDGRSCGGFAA